MFGFGESDAASGYLGDATEAGGVVADLQAAAPPLPVRGGRDVLGQALPRGPVKQRTGRVDQVKDGEAVPARLGGHRDRGVHQDHVRQLVVVGDGRARDRDTRRADPADQGAKQRPGHRAD